MDHATAAVDPFDDSAAEFFAAMDGISALCSSEEESFDAGEIERFGSMITFLREWRDFRYEPKTVKFVCEIEPGEAREAAKEVNLSQFSSAAVPKMEKLHSELMPDSNDFVMYAGGPVWALDWCPRSAESSSSDVKCEYLAVSAHPPGSEYHRIGQPLIGRGVIQIWCLVNNSIAENSVPESMFLKTRWRPRKRPLQDDPEDGIYAPGIPVTPKRSRGRPRKQPRPDDSRRPRGRPRSLPGSTNLSGQEESAFPTESPVTIVNGSIQPLSVDLADVTLSLPAAPVGVDDSKDETYMPGVSVKPKRPRGRPRKQPLTGSTNLSGQDESAVLTDSPVTTVNESIRPVSADLADVTLSLPAVPVGVDDSKDETYMSGVSVKPKRPRGRPRKQPLTGSTNLSGQDESAVLTDSPVTTVNESIRPVSADLADVTLSLPAPAGVDAFQHVNVSIPASGTESGKDAFLFTSRGEHLGHHCLDVNLDDIPLATLVSANGKVKKKPVAIEHRGRSKKKTIVNSGIPVLGIKSGSDALLPTSRGEDLGQHCLDVDLDVPLAFLASANKKLKKKLVKRRGRASKDPILTVNNDGVERGEEASAQLPPSIGLENFSLKFPSINSQGVPLALSAFTDLSGKGGLLAPRCRGRPGNSDEFQKSDVELREVALATPNTTCPKNSSTNNLSTKLAEAALPASAELNNNEDKSLPRNRERQRIDPVPNGNKFVQACGVELGVDASAVPAQAKQQDRIPPCEEILPNRLTNTNTTNTTGSISTQSITLPRVVLCLAHDGKVAWDVKWRPLNAKSSECQRQMGYLAVLLGNGSLQVWEVPLPSMVKRLYASCCREGTDPRFMRLNPVFHCSKVKRGDRQSIPLTVEWSPSGPCDFILAGCHDGTVALWRFSTEYSCQDTKPLLCFTADTVPIRALAWAPEVSDMDNTNLIVTGGHEGLKFWDLRDPYRPLWEFNPVTRIILSLDWLKDPRCIMLSYDDGTLRTISLSRAASDVPVTGISATGRKPPGVHTHQSPSFTIWSVHISRATGLVAYCGADGTTIHFQLTTKFIEKDASRNRQPHFLCGSLREDGQTLIISTPLPNTLLSDIPLSTKKSLSGCGDASLTISSNRTDAKEAQQVNSQFPALYSGDLSIVPGHGGPHTPLARKCTPTCSKTEKLKSDTSQLAGKTPLHGEANPRTMQDGDQDRKVDVFPAKIVAMHRVRWNMNKGSERWLCYGGAAGIVRCQAIGLPTLS